jgi:nanoRNase/pAp phosphatase (c-di-AMP/oligoRNAs hydrolase)
MFKLSKKNSLVVGHIDPDGDSLSSIKAVLNYLRKNNCKAYTKVFGNVPEYLSWILDDKDIVKKTPEDVEQIIVLDCAPLIERIGFKPEKPIINIDHHKFRLNEHNPEKKIYIMDRCSTASALALDFNILDDILLLGVYTDTQFTLSWNEILNVGKKLKISDEKAHKILSLVKTNYKILEELKNINIHKCRNGFIIIETEEKNQHIITEMLNILMKTAENIVLIDGNHKARLRTSNEGLLKSNKLVEVASIFSGGGHGYASVCDVNGKKTTFLSIIKQLDVPIMEHN